MSLGRRDELGEITTGAMLLTLPLVCWVLIVGSPILLVAGGVCGLVAAYLPRALPSTTRATVWTPVLFAVLFVFLAGDGFFGESPFQMFPSEKYVPVLAGVGYAALFFRQRLWQRVTVQCVSYLCLILQGAPYVIETDFPFIYLLLSAGYALLFVAHTIAYSHHSAGIVRGPSRERLDWRKSVILALCLVLTGVGGLATRGGFFAAYRHAQGLLTDFFTRIHVARNWFERSSDLWSSPGEGYMSLRRVTLRVVSDAAPGYLRGYVFRNYSQGRWSGRSPMMAAEVTEGAQTNDIMSAYLHPGILAPPPRADGGSRMRIFPVGGFHSRALLHPGDAWRFELAAEDLRGNEDGEMSPVEWAASAGYAVDLTAGASPMAAYHGPPDPYGDLAYLYVVPELTNVVASAVAKAFAEVPHGDARRAARATELYFAEAFTYKLGVRFSRLRDPLEQFLHRRKGHCELFASAATLMLRYHGVPARYVTGCVCMESAAGGYWVARQNSGHAWVEAYDARAREWFVVEATPPSGRPPTGSQFRFLGQSWDWLRFQNNRFRAWIAQGRLATIVVTAREAVASAFRWLVGTAWGRVVAIVLIVGVVLIRLYRRRVQLRTVEMDAVVELLDTAGRLLDRRLQASGVQREADQTYRAAILALPELEQQAFAELLAVYEPLRYSPSARRQPALVAALARACGSREWPL